MSRSKVMEVITKLKKLEKLVKSMELKNITEVKLSLVFSKSCQA